MILSYPVALRPSAARFRRSRENTIEQCSLISSITGRSPTVREPRCASSCNPRGKPPSAFPLGRAVTEDMPPANPPHRPQAVCKVRLCLALPTRDGVHRPQEVCNVRRYSVIQVRVGTQEPQAVPRVHKVRRCSAVLTADSSQARAQEKPRFKVLHCLAVQARAGVLRPQANAPPAQAVPRVSHLLPLRLLPSTPPETVGVSPMQAVPRVMQTIPPQPLRICQETSINLY